MITAVIFDMDGLMIDSERVTFEGYKHVLAKHNLTLSLEAYKTLLGKPVKAVYELFHKDYGDDFDVEETIKAVHQYMEMCIRDRLNCPRQIVKYFFSMQ